MGLGNLTPEGDDDSGQGGSQTYITFKNPRVEDISESSEHRHDQQYYDAVQKMRNRLGQDLNVVFGEFAAAAVEADDGDSDRLESLFEQLADSEE